MNDVLERLDKSREPVGLINDYRKDLVRLRNEPETSTLESWHIFSDEFSNIDSTLLKLHNTDDHHIKESINSLDSILYFLSGLVDSLLYRLDLYLAFIGKENIDGKIKNKIKVLGEQFSNIEIESQGKKLVTKNLSTMEKRAILDDTREPLTNIITLLMPEVTKKISYMYQKKSQKETPLINDLKNLDKRMLKATQEKDIKYKQKATEIVTKNILPVLSTCLYYLDEFSQRFLVYYSYLSKELQEEFNKTVHGPEGWYQFYERIAQKINKLKEL